MGIIFGLLSALTYGAADFFGGLSTKRNDVFAVMIVSQLFGSALLLAAIPVLGSGELTGRAMGAGMLAGVAGAAGVGFFYKGLSIGTMSVIAPVTAVLSACFPVVYGLTTGERPGPVVLTGVLVALGAVALISSEGGSTEHPSDPSARSMGVFGSRSGLPYAFVAGVGFGLFFIFLACGGDDSGLWPLVGARTGSLSTMLVGALVLRRSAKVTPGTFGQVAATGVLDVSANLFYLLATRQGLLSVVAVVTSMYPASTVLLARAVLGERMRGIQLAGLAVAAGSLVAITSGG